MQILGLTQASIHRALNKLIARETMVVVTAKITAKNILLIDDAVGSGATLNEISEKLKYKGAKKIIGYAIVGSYKGFEVIKEV